MIIVTLTFVILLKISCMARVITPGCILVPDMVKVLPEELCPYANMVPMTKIQIYQIASHKTGT